MSISELAMLVNDNFKKPLNQQLRELKYSGAYIFRTTTSFIPDFSGWYKVIVVSAGSGASYVSGSGNRRGGASGAVAISTLHLDKISYNIKVNEHNGDSLNDVTSFNNIIECANSNGSKGGIVTKKGDFNYNGLDSIGTQGASVGTFIPELMRKYSSVENGIIYESGDGILGYGAGATLTEYNNSTAFGGSVVIIIPLEVE